MSKATSLNDIKKGQAAIIKELPAESGIRRRLQDMGMIAGTKVECVGTSPCGDPKAYAVRGAVIALRSEDSSSILIFD